MAIIDRVKWDGHPKILAWKFPAQDLATWSHLIVNETQDAFLVSGGVYEGPFPAGNHELTTENLPILRNILGLVYGGKSPFTAEVWFVNKTANLDVKWGTPDPIQVIDPTYSIAVSVRAFGQFGLRVVDSKKLLMTLVGSLGHFSVEKFTEYIRGSLISRIKKVISETIIKGKVSVFELNVKIEDIAAEVEERISPLAHEYGVQVVGFHINSLNIPPDDAGMTRLKSALARKSEMDIVGYSFQQERQFDVMEAAAGSPAGGAAAMLGAAFGVGAAAPLSAALGSAFNQLSSGQTAQPAAQANPAAAVAAAPSIAPISMIEKIETLKKLAELKEAGILSQEEFDNEKSKILGA
ncbi:MAG: SPFH domain-containing protein [Caulobacter sp.]|nr:SPFH domain-containing protein [Caulobacter sp.]